MEHSFSLNKLSSSKQGTRRYRKPREFSDLGSDLSSRSSVNTEEDLGYSKEFFGIPIKKLLEEEMSKQAEPKRRAPSVIARLMGLDGLPTLQSSHKQPKKSSEDYEQKTMAMEKHRRSGKIDSRRSSRKNSLEQQEFKDVFEVLETSKVPRSSHSPQGNTSSRFTDAEMAFIQQKFMDAKRLSTDEKLHNSKEFHDALDILDSNKDLLVKFLQQPDSLFTKHLTDLQDSLPQSYCGHLASIKSSDSKCQSSGQDNWSLESETPRIYRTKPSERHPHGHARHGHLKHTSQSAKIPIDGKDGCTPPPTRIVVLKPNVDKAQVDSYIDSSPRPSHDYLSDCGSRREIPSAKHRRAASLGEKSFPDVKSRESRQLAKEITRQMRKNFSNNGIRLSSSAARGYVGDESSSSLSGNESAHESDTMTVTSRESFYRNDQNRPLSSHSSGSSVSREAKRRLSERWKIAHQSQRMGAVSRGSTLGEMLAISDMEVKPASFDPIGMNKIRNKFASNDRPARWDEPLGISSRDGLKDYLPRSRSVPASSSAFHSHKPCMPNETPWGDRPVIPKEATRRERKKASKGHFDLGESSYYGNPRSSRKKSQTPGCPIKGKTPIELNGGRNKVESISKNSCSLDYHTNVSIASASEFTEEMSNAENLSVVHENIASISVHLDPELSGDKLPKGYHSPDGLDALNTQKQPNKQSAEGSVPLQHPVAELGSPNSSKEAEQPSPISILEPPFKDDLSSGGSECFESLSADLQGLRMQLKLLKMESETYNEGSMLVSSDEDAAQESLVLVEDIGMLTPAESWESSYTVDVFLASGFSNADPDTFRASWHSSDCPVDPFAFEELEKKYGDQTSCSKAERKLFFDRINMGLLEIYQKFSDICPRVRPRRARCNWTEDGLLTTLIQLLKNEENERKDVLAKVLASNSQWIDLVDDVDVAGRELEKLILDDLIAEIVDL